MSHNTTIEDYTKFVNIQTTSAQDTTTNRANQTTDVTSFNNAINQIRNQIRENNHYRVDFGYDAEGYIVAIGIVEINV